MGQVVWAAIFQFKFADLLGVAAGVPLVLLGLLVFGLKGRRSVNVAFAAFTVTWGVQIMVARLARQATESELAAGLFGATVLLQIATALFLIWFASLHPQRNQVARNARGMILVASVPVLSMILVMVDPGLLVRVIADNGQTSVAFGPLVSFVSVPYFLAALVYATLTQLRTVLNGSTPTYRARARFVYLAIAFYLAYYSVRNLIFYVSVLPSAADAETVTLVALYGAASVFVLTLPIYLHRPGPRVHADQAMSLALWGPVGVAVAENIIGSWGIAMETGWFWRLVAVALLAYAIARYQLFDLDLRFRSAALYAIPVGVGAFTVAMLIALFSADTTNPVLATTGIAIAIAGNAAAWVYRDRLAQRFLLVGGRDTDYLDQRKLEVYRAALEDRLDPGGRWRDEAGLEGLRARLGIDAATHRVLAYAVSSAAQAPRAGPRADTGRLVLDRYRIERLLGEGAHGRTFRATDTKTGDDVAVKTVGIAPLGGRAAELLMREARILQRLEHPNVVRIIESARAEDEVYLVMQYVDGGNLAGTLARRKKLATKEALRVADQVLDGLHAAHARDVVHRDLKPENLLVTRDGTLKIADFGVARESDAEATAVSGLAAAGTLPWMSPEQVRGVDVDHRSDLYATAALLYRLVTGKHYLDLAGMDDYQVRRTILERRPRLAHAGIPAPLVPVLERALAKDPEARYADAAAMQRALQESAVPRVPAAHTPRTRQRYEGEAPG